MAEGYARASGKPGVVIVTSGPGATVSWLLSSESSFISDNLRQNVVTPMQDALSDGTPMVVFSGQVVTVSSMLLVPSRGCS